MTETTKQAKENRKQTKKGRKSRKILLGLILIILAVGLVLLAVNFYVVQQGNRYIVAEITQPEFTLSEEDIETLKEKDLDCILVLGAGVRPDGTPTNMLRDRLEVGIALYKAGAAPKLLLSGDNGQVEYNEVKVMRQYALDQQVPEEDIFLDHAGFSTYESMYRAGDVFQVKKAAVVTQKYHESRALYTGRKLGLKVWGVSADQEVYAGQSTRDLREILARDKDFFKLIFEPEPTFLGDAIPISGDGRETLD